MITSVQNGQVKQWRKLKRKRGREKEQAFLVEGFHLVDEALKSQWEVREIIFREDVDIQNEWQSYTWYQVSHEVFDAVSETENPQGVAAVVQMDELEWQGGSRVLVLDSIQDPGNLGTLIRTADAAGFDAVLLGKGTVDPFNDKVIRATQGSVFHIPLFFGELEEWIPELQGQGFHVWATSLQQATVYDELEPVTPMALIVGNEGAGVNQSYINMADERVSIPIYGQAESLNVAIASGILMYYLRN
ncbi:TrmH family RNA methyltransferase [Pontibacillus yanchengensis]|uniref:RNA methyltransferase n=1 Tax=Pontibacillus yanchengensis Y32 TaxID=1385514 RepID=A0A0A2TQ14_9BACI|nr:RNA methyltransferase [Pontibacillus yanchengensis]KGP71370.1 RNA methyltransferase [Pontibacillus yanchengensis Y32]